MVCKTPYFICYVVTWWLHSYGLLLAILVVMHWWPFNVSTWFRHVLNTHHYIDFNKSTWVGHGSVTDLEHITWPPANQIAWNVSPDGALNRVKHTLPCVKFLNARQSSNSRAQEHEGHALSTKTFRSHVTWDYKVFNALGQGQYSGVGTGGATTPPIILK